MKHCDKNTLITSKMAYQINATVYPEGDYVGLPDVIVTEVGTTKSAKTNAQGNFSLTASSPDAMIRFQFLGYKETVVKASQVAPFVMVEAGAIDLEEITVSGGGNNNNTLLYLLIAAGTIIVTASIVSAKNKAPQKVQLK